MRVGMGTQHLRSIRSPWRTSARGWGRHNSWGPWKDTSMGTWAPPLQDNLKHGEEMGIGTPSLQWYLDDMEDTSMVTGRPPRGHLEHTENTGMGTPMP